MDGSINQFPEQAARDNIDKLIAYDKTGTGISRNGWWKILTTHFDAHGGRGIMFRLFGNRMNAVISEMNEALAV